MDSKPNVYEWALESAGASFAAYAAKKIDPNTKAERIDAYTLRVTTLATIPQIYSQLRDGGVI